MKHAIYAFGLTTVTLSTALFAQEAGSSSQDELLEIEETTLQADASAEVSYFKDAPVATATKLGLGIDETPQSISIISQQQMNDFALDNINSVLRYAPGVNVESVETDRVYYTARGFDITNFQVDGLGLPQIFGNLQGNLDSAFYEEVQVLRGANGLATGSGNPSATINLVRKRPTEELQGSFEFTYGSWDKLRAVADVSSALNQSGSVRGRIVAVTESSDSYLDLYSNEHQSLYGVIEADLTETTLLTLGHTFEDGGADSPLWGALPVTYSDGSPTNYDVSTTTSADWAYWDKTSNITFGRLEQKIGDNWTAKAEASYGNHEQDSELFYMYGSPDPVTGLGLFAYPSYYTSDIQETLFNFSIDGSFELFNQEHEVVGGYSYGKVDMTQHSDYGLGIGTPITVPLEQWQGNYPRPPFTASTAGGQTVYRESSLFGATRLSATDQLKVILGARLSSGSSKGSSYGVATDTEYNDEFIPYIGLIYDINDIFSVYASYTEIFTPQTEVDINLSPLDPAEGESYEIGIKAKLFDNRAYASASVFHVEQNGIAEAVGTVGALTVYEAVPGLTSEGFETEFVGQVTENLTLSAAYTFLQIKDDNDNYAKRYTPKHLFKIAGTYAVPGTDLKLGAAARWQSDIQGGGITQDAYAVVDLMASYDITENWTASINVFNVFDEKYYNSLYWTQAFYGTPRSAELSIAYHF